MSIDTKEWGGKLNEMGMLPEVVSFSRFTQWVIDLIRAVIADETPNIVKAMLNTPVEQIAVNLDGKTICTYPVAPDGEAAKTQPAEPRADGDVPKLPSIEDEIEKSIRWLFPLASARTVAEAIHYVMSHRWSAKEAVESELTRRVAEAVADKDREISELQAALRAANHVIEVGVKCDAAAVEQIDALKQQLAASQAEVERLSRPVDKASVIVKIRRDGGAPEEVRCVEESDFVAERNAREAAEAERDELREAWNWIMSMGVGLPSAVTDKLNHRHCKPEDLLAAYHAEKGKVQQ